jgi:hypothetical protein
MSNTPKNRVGLSIVRMLQVIAGPIDASVLGVAAGLVVAVGITDVRVVRG